MIQLAGGLLYSPLACEGCDSLSCLNSTAYPWHLFSSLRILLLSSLLTSPVGIAGSAPELSSHSRGPSYRCKGQSMAFLVLSWLVDCITRGSADVVEAAHPRCMLRPFSAPLPGYQSATTLLYVSNAIFTPLPQVECSLSFHTYFRDFLCANHWHVMYHSQRHHG